VSDRPTKRERRDLAKVARIEAEKRARRAAARRRVRGLFTLLLIGVIVVGLFLYQSKKNREKTDLVNSLATELGCGEMVSFPKVGEEHVETGEVIYPRMPPESGNHRPSLAKTGVHDAPIETETTTHNLEHGAVMLQYAASVRPEVVTALNDVALGNPLWVISAPYAEFDEGTVLSMTAWEHRIDCPSTKAADAEKIGDLATAFVAARRDKAPESFPGEPNTGAGTPTTPPSPSPEATG
jgi:hypothetical protein